MTQQEQRISQRQFEDIARRRVALRRELWESDEALRSMTVNELDRDGDPRLNERVFENVEDAQRFLELAAGRAEIVGRMESLAEEAARSGLPLRVWIKFVDDGGGAGCEEAEYGIKLSEKPPGAGAQQFFGLALRPWSTLLGDPDIIGDRPPQDSPCGD